MPSPSKSYEALQRACHYLRRGYSDEAKASLNESSFLLYELLGLRLSYAVKELLEEKCRREAPLALDKSLENAVLHAKRAKWHEMQEYLTEARKIAFSNKLNYSDELERSIESICTKEVALKGGD